MMVIAVTAGDQRRRQRYNRVTLRQRRGQQHLQIGFKIQRRNIDVHRYEQLLVGTRHGQIRYSHPTVEDRLRLRRLFRKQKRQSEEKNFRNIICLHDCMN